jgi:tRNA(Ile)-lysidine synthase TilS/MesJ
MQCDHCRREAVLFQPYSGQNLCVQHFTFDVERKAKRIIRKNHWIRSGDRIGIAMEGNASSFSLVSFLASTFGKRRDLSFFGFAVDERSETNDAHTQADIVQSFGIEWVNRSFRIDSEAFPSVKGMARKGSCASCTLRRCFILNSRAQEEGATKIAMGSTLDDEALQVFLQILRGDVLHSLPPLSGVPWITPFSMVPEREVALYAQLQGMEVRRKHPPQAKQDLEGVARHLLGEYTRHHPSTRNALLNLRQAFASSAVEARVRVNEPIEDICKSCQILDGNRGVNRDAM